MKVGGGDRSKRETARRRDLRAQYKKMVGQEEYVTMMADAKEDEKWEDLDEWLDWLKLRNAPTAVDALKKGNYLTTKTIAETIRGKASSPWASTMWRLKAMGEEERDRRKAKEGEILQTYPTAGLRVVDARALADSPLDRVPPSLARAVLQEEERIKEEFKEEDGDQPSRRRRHRRRHEAAQLVRAYRKARMERIRARIAELEAL